MPSPLRIWTIGTNTVREAIRNKLLYALLVFALLLIGAGVIISSISYVEGSRILQDVGLASIRLFSLGIAVFVGVGLIHGEVYRRTIYTILSKPVSRAEFLVGKYVGLVMTLWLQLGIMTVAFVIVSLASSAPIDGGHFAAIGMVGIELAVIIAAATLFSSFTTPMLASLFTIGVYLMGHLTRDLVMIGEKANSPIILWATKAIHQILPDLEAFNFSVQAVHQLPIDVGELVWAVFYGIGYSLLLLTIASSVFRNRDFR